MLCVIRTIMRPSRSNIARVDLGAVRAAFRRVARPEPVPNIGDLRCLRDNELSLKERVVRRQIDDRVIGGRKDFADLRGPHAPGITAPEVVHPQEPAFEQGLSRRAASRSSKYTEPTSVIITKGH